MKPIKIAILYDVLDPDSIEWRVGGIQTYVRHLADLCMDAGWETMLFQAASHDFKIMRDCVTIRGVKTALVPKNGKDISSLVLPSVCEWGANGKLVVVFGQVDMAQPVLNAVTVGIQHGIYWDLDKTRREAPWDPGVAPSKVNSNPIRRIAADVFRQIAIGRWRRDAQSYNRLLSYATGYEDVDVRVCVDHNFPNWYRTIDSQHSNKPEYVIINPAAIATSEQIEYSRSSHDSVNILFARRFFWYRGTGIMAVAGKRLLAEFPNLRLTFAGEGPDDELMRQYFYRETRVQFIQYLPKDCLQIHLAHDIAVNASLGSEGSSLSVGEAMGAGCAVVATAIGGVTNMILDGYNGLLVNPTAEALYHGLKKLITDDKLRTDLGQRAWQTATQSFSLEKWRQQWCGVILDAAKRLE